MLALTLSERLMLWDDFYDPNPAIPLFRFSGRNRPICSEGLSQIKSSFGSLSRFLNLTTALSPVIIPSQQRVIL